MRVTKPINLTTLARELATAGVAVPGGLSLSGTVGTSLEQDLLTNDQAGNPVDLPAAATPVVDAHVAPPPVLEHVATLSIDRVTTTTDAAFHEIWRLTTTFKRVYRASLEMRATDAGNGDSKGAQSVLMFKGLASSVAQVGTTATVWSAQDAGATGWAIQAQTQGADLVIGVRGAAGRTVGWALSGEVVVFAPEGF